MKCKNYNLNVFIIALISLNFIYSSITNINVKGKFYQENKFNLLKKYNFREKDSFLNENDSNILKENQMKMKAESKNKLKEKIYDKKISVSEKENNSFKKKKYSYEKKIEILNDDQFKSKNNGPIKNYSRFTNDYQTENNKNKKFNKDKKNIFKSVTAVTDNKLGFKRKNFNNNRISVKYTLPSIEIDNKHKIDYYYPYFYRTHLIEYQEIIDYKDLSNDCSDLGCNWCDIKMRNNCYECRHGFFLFQESCYTVCPQNHYADVFKKKCIPMDSQTVDYQITYLKAFTIGSCKNKCGGISQDCSCRDDCIMQGNCCSDYQECQNIYKMNSNKKQDCSSRVSNCELCDYSIYNKISCKQCNSKYFLRNGECINSCYPSDQLIETNKICIKNQHCRVDNCGECVDGNPAVCKHCNNGFYLFNNQCLSVCPNKYRADRIGWVCLEAPVFAWYWIFPSRGTCYNNCGKPMQGDLDCSCTEDCFRIGNCCQDIEDFCSHYVFWR